jgi:hypothetical protein
MRRLLNHAEFVLLAVGVYLAYAWWNPDHKSDAALGVSVAVLAVVLFVRKKFYEEPEEERRRKHTDELMEKVAELLEESKRNAQQAFVVQMPSASVKTVPTVTLPNVYVQAVESRDAVSSQLQQYAQLKGADAKGTPTEVLDRLNITPTYKQGLRDFLGIAGDLEHQPQGMVEWAAKSGPAYLDILNMLSENAKRK